MHNYDEHYNMMNLTATRGEAANEKKEDDTSKLDSLCVDDKVRQLLCDLAGFLWLDLGHDLDVLEVVVEVPVQFGLRLGALLGPKRPRLRSV